MVCEVIFVDSFAIRFRTPTDSGKRQGLERHFITNIAHHDWKQRVLCRFPDQGLPAVSFFSIEKTADGGNSIHRNTSNFPISVTT